MLYCTVEGDIYFNDGIEYHMALHQQYVELMVNNVNNVYTTTSGTVQDYTGMPVDGCMKEGDTAVQYSEGTGDHIIYIYIYIYIQLVIASISQIIIKYYPNCFIF